MPGVQGEPLVIAHRGSSHSVAEHTLGAYLAAIDEGADGLECDVRLTRDGHLVCVHDRRIDRTSNGRGIVSEFDLADLGSYDFASWKSDHLGPAGQPVEERDLAADRVSVLTLERLLEACFAAPRLVRLLIETKHPTRYGGLVEQQVVRLLRRFGLADPADPQSSPVTVMSFSALGLRRIRLLAPNLPTVFLFDRVPTIRRAPSLPAGAGIAGPGVHIVRSHPDYVERLRARGHQTYVWTVNTPEDLLPVLSLGAEAIITDRPAYVLSRLGRASPSRR